MKKKLLHVTAVIILILLLSCNGSEEVHNAYQPHLGLWSGIDAAGTKATILFKKDGAGTIEFSHERYAFKYIVDYSKKPAQPLSP